MAVRTWCYIMAPRMTDDGKIHRLPVTAPECRRITVHLPVTRLIFLCFTFKTANGLSCTAAFDSWQT